MRSNQPSREWMLAAISDAAREAVARGWRAVEAQHLVSTLRLTDHDPGAQELLERILEESKPSIPRAAAGLHYLLATPFRYPPSPWGSRFRARDDEGVLYAAYQRRTACAEMGYWRWRFLTDSDGLTEIAASAQTLFDVSAQGSLIDLQAPPFDVFASLWAAPDDYSATVALGKAAREADTALIAYRSVRDPEGGTCFAVLRPEAIRPRQPKVRETWYLTVFAGGAIWQRESQRWVFPFA